jgi:hypothetical protein
LLGAAAKHPSRPRTITNASDVPKLVKGLKHVEGLKHLARSDGSDPMVHRIVEKTGGIRV